MLVKKRKIPTHQYVFSSATAKRVARIVLSGKTHHESGEYVKKFENEFAKYIGTRYALATTSGTSALQLAMFGLGLAPADEVIMPAYTFIAVAQAILSVGAIPIFVDIDDTYNLSPDAVEKSITQRTKAIIVVHMFGNVARIEDICKLVSEKNIKVIEDCAQAIGAEYRGRKVGSIGDVGCFSFNIKKQIPIGEGGMMVTSDAEIARRAVLARGTGIDKATNKDVVSLGNTSFMTELQAILGLEALQNLEKLNHLRNKNAKKLFDSLSKFTPVIILPKFLPNVRPTLFRVAFQIRENKMTITRDEFVASVRTEGIPLRSFYPHTLYSYKLFKKKLGLGRTKFPFNLTKVNYRNVFCPNAENFCRGQVGMEISPYLTKRNITDVINTITQEIRRYEK